MKCSITNYIIIIYILCWILNKVFYNYLFYNCIYIIFETYNWLNYA